MDKQKLALMKEWAIEQAILQKESAKVFAGKGKQWLKENGKDHSTIAGVLSASGIAYAHIFGGHAFSQETVDSFATLCGVYASVTCIVTKEVKPGDVVITPPSAN